MYLRTVTIFIMSNGVLCSRIDRWSENRENFHEVLNVATSLRRNIKSPSNYFLIVKEDNSSEREYFEIYLQ